MSFSWTRVRAILIKELTDYLRNLVRDRVRDDDPAADLHRRAELAGFANNVSAPPQRSSCSACRGISDWRWVDEATDPNRVTTITQAFLLPAS